jgi:hypothetical protein
MKRIVECDKDALCKALNNIGITVEELDMTAITPEYLQDLYRYLLRMQLAAWKAGKTCGQLIRETNQALRDEKPVLKTGTLFR